MNNEFENNYKNAFGIIKKVCLKYQNGVLDVDDMIQEASIRIFMAYPRFKKQASFNTWAYAIAFNCCMDTIRATYSKNAIKTIDIQNTLLYKSLQEDTCNNSEYFDQMYNAIEQLRAKEKALIDLFLSGKSYDQICEISEIAPGNLRVIFSRVRNKLRSHIKCAS